MREIRSAALALAILLSVAGVSAAATIVGPSGLFKAKGHRLYLTCAGEGKPTVVLDAGFGDDHTIWPPVKKAARWVGTRVCAYDRYGVGASAGAPATRTIDQAVNDLRALLRTARIKGPYVFGAYGIGGLIDREYARRYPKEVAGMALFDSAPDDFDLYLGYEKFAANETLNIKNASAALRVRDSLGAKPVAVVEAEDVTSIQELYAGGKADFFNYWDSAQRKLARISGNSIFIVAMGTIHPEMLLEAPALSLEVIRLVADAAKHHTGLPACERTRLPKLRGNCDAQPVPPPTSSDTTTTTTTSG